ncbi:MAG: COG4315 family predicted lipoprotein [Candidatus Limnocylindria bacterium]
MRFASVMAAAFLLLAACNAQTGAGSTAPSTGPSTAASAAASSGSINVTVSHTSAGDALAGAGGMTLYVFDNDTAGSSTCTGGCASTWPALLGDGSAVVAGSGVTGTFGTTTRDDGSKQVTHNGQPLYYYAPDQAAGDAMGDGVGGVWHIAPVGAASASQAPAVSTGLPGY